MKALSIHRNCFFIIGAFLFCFQVCAQTLSLKSRNGKSNRDVDISRIYGIETNDSGKIITGSVIALEGSVLKFKPRVKDTVLLFNKEHVLRMWYCNDKSKDLCGKKRIFSGKIWRYALFFIVLVFLAVLVAGLNWGLALGGFLVTALGLLIAKRISGKKILDMKRDWKF